MVMGHTPTTAPSDILVSTAITNQLVTLHSIRCMPSDFPYPYFRTLHSGFLFFFLPIRLKLYNMDRVFKQYSHYTNLEKEKLQRQFFSPVCLPFTISVTRLWMSRPNKTKVPEGGGFLWRYTKFTMEKSFFSFLINHGEPPIDNKQVVPNAQ